MRLILPLLAAFSTLSAAQGSTPDCSRLNLPEERLGPPPTAYVDFCESNPGHCEDFALEKRRRLVEAGLPRAALTMAIAHHRIHGFSHAVLLVETTRGSFVLDQLSGEINCWNRSQFNFETGERPDGLWTRFDQSRWYIPQSALPIGSDAR